MAASDFGNLYNILQIPPTAEPKEIKRARDRLARMQHTDKGGDGETIKAINEAFRVLSNPELRREYDSRRDDSDDLIAPKVSGFLSEGPRYSEKFIQKFTSWVRDGIPDKRVSFTPPYQPMEIDSEGSSPHPAKNLFRDFVAKSVPSIKECIARLLPEDVMNWKFTPARLPSSTVLFSPAWQAPIPEGPKPSLIREATQSFSRVTELILGAVAPSFVLPNVKALSQEMFEWMEMTKDVPLFSGDGPPLQGSLFHAIFPDSWTEKDVGLGPLCPRMMAPQFLGIEHVKKIDGNEVCACCSESFGVMRWKVSCAECGYASCRDCLSMARVPGYKEKIAFCLDCQPKVKKKIYLDPWVDQLKDKKGRALVTVPYLALIDELGFASKSQFEGWMKLLLDEGRMDLALQCAFSAGFDMKELALQLYAKFEYGYALTALSLYPEQNWQFWIAEGDRLAAENNNAAFLFYVKGEMKRKDFRKRAKQFHGFGIGWMCQIAGTRKSSKKKMMELFNSLLEEKKLGLAFLTGTLCTDSSTLYRVLKKLTSGEAEIWLGWLSDYYQNKLSFPPLEDQKDHLRWPYIGDFGIDRALSLFIDHAKTKPAEEAIFFLRRKFPNENFVVLRDEYMKKKEYAKMVLCHLLTPHRLSFEDMVKKSLSKDIHAALHYALCRRIQANALGDEFFQTGERRVALVCYSQAEDYQAIVSKVKECPYEDKLLYLSVLYSKFPNHPERMQELLQLLLTKPKNIEKVQELLLASLQTIPEEKSFYHHQLLAETGLSLELQLGQLEALQLLYEKDEKWLASRIERFNEEFKNRLRKAFYTFNIPLLLQEIELIHPLTKEAAASVIKEYENLDGPHKALRLVVGAIIDLYGTANDRFIQAANSIATAMMIDSSETTLALYTMVLERIQSLMEKGSLALLRGILPLRIQEKSQFADHLVSSPDLKLLLRAEKSMAKFPSLQKTKSYLDLTKGVDNALGMIGYYLSAAQSLLECKKENELHVSRREVEAFRKGITELLITAYAIGEQVLNPATQLYNVRSAIGILTENFAGSIKVTQQEQGFFEILHEEAEKLSAVAPVVLNSLIQTYDLVYYDVILRKAILPFLNKKRENGDTNAQYLFLEGTLKRWLSQEEYSFEEERKKTMEALLHEKGHTIEDVEALLNWSLVTRGKNGFLSKKARPLNLEGQSYSHAKGISFDLKEGTIEFNLESSKKPIENVVDSFDLWEVMKKGIVGAEFTLDPPSPSMPYHPFQNMLYAPASLKGTHYLATMLEVDMLLKKLSMRTDVSSFAPFDLQDAKDSLYKRMPKELRDKFIALEKEDLPESAGQINRFWVQAEKLPYYHKQEGEQVIYTLGTCKMSVKTHRMVRDREGNLVDATEEEEKETPAKKFAKLMTEEYDNLGKVFPELARLRELVHLQSLSQIAQGFYQNIQEQSAKLKIRKRKVVSHLDSIRGQFHYPQTDRIEELVDECLRKNRSSRSSVPYGQLHELRRDILNQLEENDKKLVDQVTKNLADSFHARGIRSQVKSWLDYDDKRHLVATLRESWKEHERAKLLKICDTFKKAGIATEARAVDADDSCSWVPACFREGEGRRVYGGVNMNARLVSGGSTPPPPPPGAPIGPQSFRHIQGMGPQGQLYGTTIGVDKVSGNPFKIHDLRGLVKDQFNAADKYPDTKAGFKPYTGVTDTLRTTSHYSNGAYHHHKTTGYTDCTNAQGNATTYRSNDKSHRCADNNNSSAWSPRR